MTIPRRGPRGPGTSELSLSRIGDRTGGYDLAAGPERVLLSHLSVVGLSMRERSQMATSSAQPPSALGAAAEHEAQTTLGLLRRVLDELSILFRQEVRLALAELSRSLTGLLRSATSFAVAGAVLFAGLLMLLAAAVLGLAVAVPAWLAALIIGCAAVMVGFALLGIGRAKLRATSMKPEYSAESISKDKDVLTRRVS
jgi:hypothetical protein